MMRALGMLRLSDSLAKHTRTDPPLGPDLEHRKTYAPMMRALGMLRLSDSLTRHTRTDPPLGPDLKTTRETMLQLCALWGCSACRIH